MQSASGSSPSSSRSLVVVFAVVLGLTLWFTTRAWHASLIDRHEFRQFQTAISTYWIKAAGYRLNYETPLFGPPWSIPLEFPVYHVIVAETSRLLGTGLESTARGVSLFFLFATLPAIYGLAGLLKLAPSRRLLVLGAVLSSPVYLFYGRSFMIETTALCFSTWFLYAVARAVRDQQWRFAFGAVAFAVLAGLAKVTTLVVFLPPAALLTWSFWKHHWARRAQDPAALRRTTLFAVVPVVVGVGISYWWVRHGDHLKHINPLAGFLLSTELTKWNWGTWDQRGSVKFWAENWSNISQFVLGAAPLSLLLFCATFVDAACRRTAAWCAVFFLCGPLLFSNLYFMHDYYYCANAVFLLAGAGFLLAGVWDSDRLNPAAKRLALVLVLGAQFGLYYVGYGEYQHRESISPPGIALVARTVVPPDGVVVIYGWDWNAMLPYYAERRAIMVPRGREREIKVLDEVLRQLPPLRVAALIVHHDEIFPANPEFLHERLNRFGFFNAPIATSPAGDLYLPEEAIPAALEKLRGHTYTGVEVSAVTPAAANEPALHEDDPRGLALPIFSPAPFRARSLFGFTPGADAGHAIILAHPISEIHFTPPLGAQRIDAIVGLADNAYAATNPAPSDGITVEIFEARPDGLRRVLFRRDLDPLHRPADAGPQVISLTGVGPFTGPVIFKITGGPKGNLTSDWANWSRIEIH